MKTPKTKTAAAKRGRVAASAPKRKSSFAKCAFLAGRYGDEERFRAVEGSEFGALVSSKDITDFLKAKAAELAKAAGGKALQWVTAELLKAFGVGGTPTDLEEIKRLLLRIIELEEQILSKLEDVLLEVQFQHLITRSFDAVETILNIYDRLQRLSLVKGEAERERIAAEIKRDVLDGNTGVFISLRKISAVLTGKGQLAGGDSLIKVFADRWFKSYTATQFREDTPLSAYWKALDQWLHELSIIQYMGVSALANARIANGDFETLEGEIDAVVKNMEDQQKLLNDEVPEWARTLPADVLRPDTWYVLHCSNLDGLAPLDDWNVMYGPPQSDISKYVRFRGRNRWNGDEEWGFEKVANSAVDNDVFTLVVHTRNSYLYLDKKDLKITYTASNSNRPKLRLLMADSLNAALNNKPRGERLVPVLGFVGKSEYVVSKTSSGTIICGNGNDVKKAIRYKVVPPS